MADPASIGAQHRVAAGAEVAAQVTRASGANVATSVSVANVPNSATARVGAVHAAPPGSTEVALRFLEGRGRTLSMLEVEAPVAWRASERLRRALFLLRIQVVASEREHAGDRVVQRMHIVEFDGAPISTSRRLEIQKSLVSLLDLALAPRRRTHRE